MRDREFEEKVERIIERGDRSLSESRSYGGYFPPVESPNMDVLFEAKRNIGLQSKETIYIESTLSNKLFLQHISATGKLIGYLGTTRQKSKIIKLIAEVITDYKLEFVVASKLNFTPTEKMAGYVKTFFNDTMSLQMETELVPELEKLLIKVNPRFARLRTFFLNPISKEHKDHFRSLALAIKDNQTANLSRSFLKD